jgi:hypothetical protein
VAKIFTNTGAVAMVIGDTSIAAAGTDVVSDDEAAALAAFYPSTSFAASELTATDHYNALSYPAGLTSEDR